MHNWDLVTTPLSTRAQTAILRPQLARATNGWGPSGLSLTPMTMKNVMSWYHYHLPPLQQTRKIFQKILAIRNIKQAPINFASIQRENHIKSTFINSLLKRWKGIEFARMNWVSTKVQTIKMLLVCYLWWFRWNRPKPDHTRSRRDSTRFMGYLNTHFLRNSMGLFLFHYWKLHHLNINEVFLPMHIFGTRWILFWLSNEGSWWWDNVSTLTLFAKIRDFSFSIWFFSSSIC